MMKKIANIVGKDKSTITVLIENLIALGYVKKEESEKDKRVTYILLTEKSYAIQKQFDNISEALLKMREMLFVN